jgi:hypothetical protein
MRRWLLAGAVVVAAVVLGAVAAAPALHSPGSTDCATLEGNSSEPEHGTHESDMYAETDGPYADCPVDDGAAMGAAVTPARSTA